MSHKPDPSKIVNLKIDGMKVTVPEGTTILEAAKTVNINIPVLCEHPDLCRRAFCRICVVECDGRGKLVAACANDVWEDVNIITVNKHLINIRRTILEMIIANHPLDCLKCVRSKNCDLQALAVNYGITSSAFENEAGKNQPVIESETIVRDMDKCVKCARCVEACQELQTIRALNTAHRSHEFEICTAYNQALENTSCVFCGECAKVCPVGAIYGYDQTTEVWNALNSGDVKTIAAISPDLLNAIKNELSSSGRAESITSGKLTAAVKLLGFDRVYDAAVAANVTDSGIRSEIKQRKDNSGYSLPVISGDSQGVTRFIRNFYPDMESHLTIGKNPRKLLAADIKNSFAKETELNPADIISISFVPYIAQKYAINSDKNDYALTAAELIKMIKLAGIKTETLPEEKFDENIFDSSKNYAQNKQNGIDSSIKKITAKGYAKARKIMEAIQKNECDADWIEIESSPDGYSE